MTVQAIQQSAGLGESLQVDFAALLCRLQETEEALRAERESSERAREKARSEQEELLSIIAHDMRNPLAPIQNSVELLRLPTTTNSQKQRAIDIIEIQVRELHRMLTDLLDASRITRGKIDLLKQPISLTDVVTRAKERCRRLMDQRNQQLNLSIPSEPIWLYADPTRLEQAVSDLLAHAAKTGHEGTVIHLHVTIDGDAASVRIENAGIGIPAEDLPRVFDLVFQSDRAGSSSRRGLGLAVVRGLVELHGGSVEAQSDGSERGSRFIVRLPRLSDTDRRLVEPRPSANELLRLPAQRILSVTDNADFATEWSLLLRIAGHEPHTARNSEEALEAARSFQPHVIILDTAADALNAKELAQLLRVQPGAEKSLLVAIADPAGEARRFRAEEFGCAALLFKPVMVRDFLQLLGEKVP